MLNSFDFGLLFQTSCQSQKGELCFMPKLYLKRACYTNRVNDRILKQWTHVPYSLDSLKKESLTSAATKHLSPNPVKCPCLSNFIICEMGL